MKRRQCPKCSATYVLETVFDAYPASRFHSWTCEYCGHSWTREDIYGWTDEGTPFIQRGIEDEEKQP